MLPLNHHPFSQVSNFLLLLLLLLVDRVHIELPFILHSHCMHAIASDEWEKKANCYKYIIDSACRCEGQCDSHTQFQLTFKRIFGRLCVCYGLMVFVPRQLWATQKTNKWYCAFEIDDRENESEEKTETRPHSDRCEQMHRIKWEHFYTFMIMILFRKNSHSTVVFSVIQGNVRVSIKFSLLTPLQMNLNLTFPSLVFLFVAGFYILSRIVFYRLADEFCFQTNKFQIRQLIIFQVDEKL